MEKFKFKNIDRQTGRQADRETDKQTDMQTGRQVDRQIDRHADWKTDTEGQAREARTDSSEKDRQAGWSKVRVDRQTDRESSLLLMYFYACS